MIEKRHYSEKEVAALLERTAELQMQAARRAENHAAPPSVAPPKV